MKFVTIRELKINGSKVIRDVEGEDAIITKRGKPVAVLVPIDEDSLEEFVIAHNPKLLREMAASYAEYKEKGGTDLETMIKKLKRRRG
jgi:prevent-host-death family protein